MVQKVEEVRSTIKFQMKKVGCSPEIRHNAHGNFMKILWVTVRLHETLSRKKKYIYCFHKCSGSLEEILALGCVYVILKTKGSAILDKWSVYMCMYVASTELACMTENFRLVLAKNSCTLKEVFLKTSKEPCNARLEMS